MASNKLELLEHVPLFDTVDPSLLEPLLSYFVTNEYERGEQLWREGSEATYFTFVVEGKVKVVKYKSGGEEVILGIFDEGDAVGHIAVFQRINYPAKAVALDDTLCLSIHRDHFIGTIKKNSELLEGLLDSMMKRNADLVRRVKEVSTTSAEQRLAMLFDKFALKTGVRRKLDDGTMGVFLDLPLSRRDISDLINTRVETAIRIMSRWNKNGPVRTLDDGFLIDDMEQLERLGAGD
jgi:CRP/FNR family transcriptional regulator